MATEGFDLACIYFSSVRILILILDCWTWKELVHGIQGSSYLNKEERQLESVFPPIVFVFILLDLHVEFSEYGFADTPLDA